jgi:hypothetical protein
MSTLKVSTISPLGTDATNTITIGASGDVAAGVFTNVPAFEAYLSSSSGTVSNNVATKVQFDTEIYDTDGTYDNSSNYRFTPGVAGKYFIYAQVYMYMGSSNVNVAIIHIYKNGSSYMTRRLYQPSNPAQAQGLNISATLDLDADDYIEIFGQSQGADSNFNNNDKNNHFGAYRIIGA